MSHKPTPLKVFGRSHYACTRCKLSKIKCSGEKPACANCKAVNKGASCQYPARDRKIMIMELDLNTLHARVQHLEELVRTQGPAPATRNELMVQNRVLKLHANESYLLSDKENDHIPYRLLLLCADQLPEEQYAWRLLDLVCKTYLLEFYLVDADALPQLVEGIYKFFRSADLPHAGLSTVLELVPPVQLCYLFVILGFGEQMFNNTLEKLPPSIAEVTGPSTRIPGLEFYTTATQLFNLAHEEIDVQFIQSAVLLGLFACNLNRYNTVYNYFGVALRLAVASGFHRQMETPTNMSELQLAQYRVREEKTKRLWWSIYVIDVVWAAKMNMPVHIDYTDTDVALPNESPILNLDDGFSTEMLASNVQLVKYVAKFNMLIYGPNIRTFLMNYINTEKFNQALLVKNILCSLSDIIGLFEASILLPYKNVSIVLLTNRNLANLCFRYNQLVILVVEPLLSLVYKESTACNIEDNMAVASAIAKGVMAAARTVRISMKIYEHNKLFVLGFWDSQHLFTATLVLIGAEIAGCPGLNYDYNRAIALLKYMADSDNINARNAMQKLEQVRTFLRNMPEVRVDLNLSAEISTYVTKRTPPLGGTAALDEFYNPFSDPLLDELRLFENVAPEKPGSLYDIFGFTGFSKLSQSTLTEMAMTMQSWDNFRGLPIHIYGTGRVEQQQPNGTQVPASKKFRISNLI